MRALSPRESRLVAALVLLALLILADVAIVAPIAAGFSDRAGQRRELLARFSANDRSIAAIPRLRREAESRNVVLQSFVLTAPDAGAAGELLRDRLQAAVAAVGGDARGGEDLPPPPGMIAVRINARLSSRQLDALLAQIENTRPLIVVTALGISANDALVTGRAATLDVQLEACVPYRPAPAR